MDQFLCEGGRKLGKPPVPAAKIAEVLVLTCAETPGEATHWTGRALAEAELFALHTAWCEARQCR
jgi:hypothetical protein